MRFIVVVAVLCLSFFSISQEVANQHDTLNSKREIPVFMHAGGGVNWENKPTVDNIGYGIHLVENNITPGYYWVFGGRTLLREKFDLNLQFIYRTRSRNSNAILEGYQMLYPEKQIIFRDDKFNNQGIFGIRFAFGYKFEIKSFQISPKISFGTTFGPMESYEYVVREPSTNYFDRYRVINRAKGEFPLSLGFNFTHSKLNWLELVGEFAFAKTRNVYKIYKVEIGDEYNVPEDEKIEFNQNRWFFSLGLHFNLRLL